MTEEERKEFASAYDDYDKARRQRAIRAMFERDSIGCELYDFNYFVRGWCWLKTLTCLLLKRTRGSYIDKHYFTILAYDESRCMESMSWESVWISPKLFSGWQACIASDGT